MAETSVDLAALARGDAAAWDALVSSQGDGVKAAVARVWRRYGRDARDAEIEDVVQDVFVRLARDEFALIRRYDPARASLGAWLAVIASSAAVDALRRARPTKPLEAVAAEPTAAPPRGGVELPRGLLTDRQAAILRLIFEQDLETRDVARLLGVTEQTVRSAKHKALERLRAYYRDQDSSEGP